jgi:hypothetical protein
MTKVALVVAFAILLGGCASTPATLGYQGVLRLSWTIDGQPVSDRACADVDHLVITVEASPSVGVAIAPVLCTRGTDWERDDVPEGFDTVVVDAVNRAGETTFESASMIGITGTRAAAPAMVDLRPL